MGQSVLTEDAKVFQGTAVHSNGTFVADFTIPTDQVMRLRAWAFLTAASGGHLSAGCAICGEYVVQNENGSCSALGAETGSQNPNDSNTTNITSRVGDMGVQATDNGVWNGISQCNWSVVGTVARLTVTNKSSTTDANVTVFIEAKAVGST